MSDQKSPFIKGTFATGSLPPTFVLLFQYLHRNTFTASGF